MSEAAPLTPYSAEYLSLLARKKKLAAKKVGNAWYTTKPILDEYMKRQMIRNRIQNGDMSSVAHLTPEMPASAPNIAVAASATSAAPTAPVASTAPVISAAPVATVDSIVASAAPASVMPMSDHPDTKKVRTFHDDLKRYLSSLDGDAAKKYAERYGDSTEKSALGSSALSATHMHAPHFFSTLIKKTVGHVGHAHGDEGLGRMRARTGSTNESSGDEAVNISAPEGTRAPLEFMPGAGLSANRPASTFSARPLEYIAPTPSQVPGQVSNQTQVSVRTAVEPVTVASAPASPSISSAPITSPAPMSQSAASIGGNSTGGNLDTIAATLAQIANKLEKISSGAAAGSGALSDAPSSAIISELSKLRVVQGQPNIVTRSFKTVFGSKPLIYLAIGLIVFFSIFPTPFVFGFFDGALSAAKNAWNDANTVMGFRPGTHANELLLLDKQGNVSIMGHIETSGQFRSYAADGVAPIVVDSKTEVKNLNAEYVGGQKPTDFTLAYVTKNGNVTTEDVFLDGNVEVGKTLLVKGATKLLSSLTVDGGISVLGDARVAKSLTVDGPAYFNAILNAANIRSSGVASLGTLITASDASLGGNVSVGRNLKVRGGIEAGSSIIADGASFGDLGVTGDFSAGGAVALGNPKDEITVSSKNLTVDSDGNLAAGGNISAAGNASISGNASVGGSASVQGDLTVVGNFSAANFTLTGSSSITDLNAVNSTTTNATSTNFFATLAHIVNGTIDTFTSTVANIATLAANSISVGALTATDTVSTNLIATNATTTDATTTNSYINNLIALGAAITNSTTTDATTTNAFISNLVATTAAITDASLANAIVTNATTTNATTTNEHVTNLAADNSTTTNAYVANSTTTNAYIANASIGDITATGTVALSGPVSLPSVAANMLLSTDGSSHVVATSSPQVAYLAATSSLATSTFAGGLTVAGGFAVGTNRLVADQSTGFVGIGTAAPKTALHVSASNNDGAILTLQTNDIGSASGAIQFSNSANTTLSAIGSNRNVNDAAGNLEFMTGGGLLRAIIDSLGNMALGLPSAASKLDVSGGANTVGTGNQILTLRSAANSGRQLQFGVDNATGYSWIRSFESVAGEQPLILNPLGGNIGIGTTSPFVRLSVAGDAYIGGNLTATGTLAVSGASSLQDLTFANATGTNATTTNFFATNLSATNLSLTDTTIVHSTTTAATTTNFAITSLTSGRIPFATTGGALIDSSNLTFDNTVGKITVPYASTTALTSSGSAYLATAGGNVGIGTTSPFARLSVAGDAYIGGSLTATGTLTVGGALSVTGPTNIQNLTFGNATGTSATTTNFYSQYGSFGSLGVGTSTTTPGALVTTGNAYIGGSITIAGSMSSSVTNGQIRFLGIPQGTNIDQGTVYINPASAGTNNVLLGLAVNGVEKQRLDAEGDVQIVGTYNSTNPTGTNLFSGNLSVGGNTTIGTNASNTVAFNSSVSSDIVPEHDNTFSLGSPTKTWANFYASNAVFNSITTNNASTTAFIINSANNTFDTEDSSLEFSRGSSTPNAIIKWNSVLKQFEFNNFPVDLMSTLSVSGTATSSIAGNLLLTGTPTGTGISQGSLYINPSSGPTNYTLFDAAVNGVDRFRIDAEGDTFIQGSLGLQNSIYNLTDDTLTVDDKLQVNGNEIKDSTGTTRLALGTTNTITGDLTTTGNLTTGTVNGQTISSAASFTGSLATVGDINAGGAVNATGAVTAPYFVATNALATSTFAGGINAQSGKFVVQQTTGNVGIGTSSPVSLLTLGTQSGNATLTIDGFNQPVIDWKRNGTLKWETYSDTSDNFNIRSVVAGTNPVVIESSGAVANTLYVKQGKVGIGTTTPGTGANATNLDVVGGGITTRNFSAGSFGNINIFNDGQVGFNMYALGSTFGGTSFGGVTGNNQAVIEGKSGISSLYLGTNGTAPLIFAPNRAAAMTIINGGNVGIGTTSPAAGLDVNSPTGMRVLSAAFSAPTTGKGLELQYQAGTDQAYIYAYDRTNSVVKNLVLGGAGNAVTILGSNGNVGIGATNPQTKLDVQGTASSTVLFTNNGTVGAPGHSFASSQNTGMFFTSGSPSYLAFSVAGTQEMALKSTGGVLIPNNGGYLQGDTVGNQVTLLNLNSSNNLSIGQSTNMVDTSITSGTGNLNLQTAGGTKVTILSGGNVGIGTTSPFVRLSVAGDTYIGGNLTATGTTALQGTTFTNATGTNATTTNFYTTNLSAANLNITTTSIVDSTTTAATTTNFAITSLTSGRIPFATTGGALIDSSNLTFDNTVGKITVPYASTTALTSSGSAYLATAGGNVGIGTTNPLVKLSLGTDITQQKLAIYDGSGDFYGFGLRSGFLDFQTHSLTRMTVDQFGDVGIGTTTPGSKLDVNGVFRVASTTFSAPTVGSGIEMSYRGDGNGYITSFDRGTSAYKPLNIDGSTLVLNNFSGGSVGIGTSSPTANESFSRLTVAAADSSALLTSVENSGTGQVGQVLRRTGGTTSRWYTYTPGSSTDLRFNSAARGDVVTFQAGGNVGIGTTTPAAIGDGSTPTILQVNGTATGLASLLELTTTQNSSGNGVGAITFGTSGVTNTNQRRTAEISSTLTTSSSASAGGNLTFYTSNAGNLNANVTIADTGNVGVGTTTPSVKFAVEGSSVGAQTVMQRISSGPAAGDIQLDTRYDAGRGTWALQSVSRGGTNLPLLLNPDGGNVGIGATNPGALFDVNLGASNQAYFGTTGSGNSRTTIDAIGGGRLFQNNTSGTLTNLIQTNGVSYINGGNVGIGTATPATTLDTNGTVRATGFVSPTSGSGVELSYTGGVGFVGSVNRNTSTFLPLQINGSPISLMNGNVGIATTTSNNKLFVGATGTSINDANVPVQISANAGGTEAYYGANNNGYGLLVGYSNVSGRTGGVIREVDSQNLNFLVNNTTNALSINSAGNVGIGTTSPTAFKLTVSDTANSYSAGFQSNGGQIVGVGNFSSTPSVQGLTSTFGATNLSLNPNGGNVGIGTTNPSGLLSLGSSITNKKLFIFDNASEATGFGQASSEFRMFGAASGINHISFGKYALGTDTFTEQMRIDNAGNVGVGTTSPGTFNSTKLDVNGGIGIQDGTSNSQTNATMNTGAGYLSIEAFNATNSAKKNIALAAFGGNVGIGTTSPSVKFSVGGAAGDTTGHGYFTGGLGVGVVNTTAGTIQSSGAVTVGGALSIPSNTWMTSNTPTNILRDTFFGYSSTYRAVEIGLNSSTRAISLGVDVSSNPSNQFSGNEIVIPNGSSVIAPNAANNSWIGVLEMDSANKLQIGRANNALASGGYLTVDTSGGAQNGNVGIGTTSPSNKLVVVGSGTGSAMIGDVFGGNYAGIRLNGSQAANDYNFLSAPNDQKLYINRPTGNDIAFSEANGTAQVTIKSGGNVGIGSTNPGDKLTLSGAATSGTSIRESITNTATVGYADQFLLNDGGQYAGLQIGSSAQTGTEFGSIARANTAKLVSSAGNFIIGTEAASPLIFGTNSAENMRIASGGNVGIGTTGPNNKLEVAKDFTYNNFTTGALRLSAASNSSRYIVSGYDNTLNAGVIQSTEQGVGQTSLLLNPNGGNVGIGTTTPYNTLQVGAANSSLTTNDGMKMAVYGTAGSPASTGMVQGGIFRVGNTSPNTSIDFGTYSASPFGGWIQVTQPTGLSATFPLILNPNGSGIGIGTTTPVGVLSIAAAGSTVPSTVNIKPGVNMNRVLTIDNSGPSGDFSITDNRPSGGTNAQISFDGFNGYTLLQPSGGNVGIGTTGPTSALQVVSTANSAWATQIANNGSTGANGLYVSLGASATGVPFRVDAPSVTSALQVSNTGNVGIGNTGSTYKLDVSGTLHSSGNYTTEGTVNINADGTVQVISPQTNSYAAIRFNKQPSIGGAAGFLGVDYGHAITTTSSNGDMVLRADGGNLIFSNTTAEAMRISSGGNVGIGTTTPSNKLTIVDSSENAVPTDTPASWIGAYIQRTYTSASAAGLAIQGSTKATNGEGRLFLGNADEYDSTYIGGGNGIIRFQTRNAGAASSEVMRIAANGNVGIGTTSPSALLALASAPGNNPQLIVKDTAGSGSGGNGIGLYNDYAAAASRNWGLAQAVLAYGDFSIRQSNAQGGNPFSAGTDRLYINASGNVGIGTTSPAYLLGVEGKIGISGTANPEIYMLSNDAANSRPLIRQSIAGTEYALFGLAGSTNDLVTGSVLGDFVLSGRSTKNIIFTPDGSTASLYLKNGGNVGIGTTNPATKLEVAGANGAESGAIRNNYSTSFTDRFIEMYHNGDSAGAIINVGGINDTSKSLNFQNGGVTGMTLVGGNVGIGISGPSAKFHVLDASLPNGNAAPVAYISGGADGTLGALNTAFGVYPSATGSQRYFYIQPGDNSAFRNTVLNPSGGNVGIGTTSPATTLSVGGSGYVTGGLGVGMVNTAAGSIQTTGDITMNGNGRTLTWNNPTSGVNHTISNDSSGNLTLASAGTTVYQNLYASGNRYNYFATNVGIGTTNPGKNLDVQGTIRASESGSGKIDIGIASNAGTIRAAGTTADTLDVGGANYLTLSTFASSAWQERMRITNGGNVGIGTTTPGALLEMLAAGGSSANIGLWGDTNVNTGDKSNITFKQRIGGGQNESWIGQILATTDGTTAGNQLQFKTGAWNNAKSVSTVMTLTGAGNVGIGTTSPMNPLTIIKGNGTAFNISYDGNPANAARTGLFMWTRGSSIGLVGGGVEQTADNVYTARSTQASIMELAAGATTFYGDTSLTAGNTYTPTARLTITNTGNVGIGTTNPSATKLEIDVASAGVPLRTKAGTAGTWDMGQNVGGISGDDTFGFYSSTFGSGHSSYPLMQMNSSTGNVLLAPSGTGKVGIGTTTPAYKLNVTGTIGVNNQANDSGIYITPDNGSYGSIQALNNNFSSAKNLILQQSGGNVGIGTTGPNSVLDIQAPQAIERLTSTTGTNATYYRISNTGGTAFLGRQGSVGNEIFSSNGLAYSLGIDSNGTNALQLGVNDTAALTIINGGNVGIGTTSPNFKLSVTNSASAGGINIDSSGSPTSEALSFSNLSSLKAYVGLDMSSNALISGSVANDLSLRSNGGNILFSTDSGVSAQMYLKNGGNVGIGVIPNTGSLVDLKKASGNALSLMSDNAPVSYVTMTMSATNNYSDFMMGQTKNAGALSSDAGAGSTVFKNTNNGSFVFAIDNSANITSTPASALVITSSKNVGIGTANPQNLLTVGAYNSGVSASGFKQGLLSVDNLLVGQSEGEAYFGRIGVKESQLGTFNYGVTWSAKDSNRSWYAIAMSSDGRIQTALQNGGLIYISTDYGTTWTSKGTSQSWYGVSMSADGKIQTAVADTAQIYVSTDYGNTWTAKDSSRSWRGISVSSDGRYQTASVFSGQLYTSSDYGNTWTATGPSASWYRGVAVSSDGRIQLAAPIGGQLYVSTDYGNTWTAKDSSRSWYGAAMSADGRIQTATVNLGQLYVSTDYGNTWTAKDSSRGWYSVAMSATGQVQLASINSNGNLYVSTDYGGTWTSATSSANWYGAAMSSDAKVMASTVNGGQIYESFAYSVIGGGNLGIGTTTPVSTLTVAGSACIAGTSGGNVACPTTAGTIYYRASGTFNVDLAENYKTNDLSVGAGDIVAVDSTAIATSTIVKATQGSHILGIVSTDPGITLGGADSSFANSSSSRPVALSGRVPVKVNGEGGNISIGDRIALSSTPGVGRKAYGSEEAVGTALESWSGTALDQGLIMVFVQNRQTFDQSQFSIDSTGNVGIGTTTPMYKMQVNGDIAATAFVNVSTRSAKKDISYLDDAQKMSMLDKLKTVGVATYRYNTETEDAPLRMGLIAEEAPSEVLADTGKGVDIYKMSAFILSGVQEMAKQLDDLKTQVAANTADIAAIKAEIASSTVAIGAASASATAASSTVATASTTQTITWSSDLGAQIIAFISAAGIRLENGIAYISNAVVDKLTATTAYVQNATINSASVQALTVGTTDKRSGITLYDQLTGDPYCLSVAGGQTRTQSGVCPDAATSTAPVVVAPVGTSADGQTGISGSFVDTTSTTGTTATPQAAQPSSQNNGSTTISVTPTTAPTDTASSTFSVTTTDSGTSSTSTTISATTTTATTNTNTAAATTTDATATSTSTTTTTSASTSTSDTSTAQATSTQAVATTTSPDTTTTTTTTTTTSTSTTATTTATSTTP